MGEVLGVGGGLGQIFITLIKAFKFQTLHYFPFVGLITVEVKQRNISCINFDDQDFFNSCFRIKKTNPAVVF